MEDYLITWEERAGHYWDVKTTIIKANSVEGALALFLKNSDREETRSIRSEPYREEKKKEFKPVLEKQVH